MSAPDGQTFLFVNKHQDSSALSNNRTGPQTYSEINSHVQRLVKRRLSYRQKAVKGSTQRLVGWNKTSRKERERVRVKEEEEEEEEEEEGEEDDDEAEQRNALILKSEPEEPDFNADPSLAIDSYCQSTVRIDNIKQGVIHYFNTVWMPSVDQIPHGCQVTGFTPIWPNDGKLSFNILQGAFQSSDEVSMYALLTAATRRMKLINKINFPNPALPDFYAVKSIQALRSFIAEAKRPNDRLILDLSYLVLAELYVKSPSRSEVYWRMTRNLIVSCGGLHKLPPFTAQVALAYDFFIAAGTLTAPALDPLAHPVLVGLPKEGTNEALHAKVLARLELLDPRIRIMAQESERLTETIKSLRALPGVAVEGVLVYLQDPGSQLYALISAPFVPSATKPQGMTGLQTRITAADALAIHVRFQAYMLWLWFSAVGILDEKDQPPATRRPPRSVLNEISAIWKYLDKILFLLSNSGWMMQEHVVLWVCAVGFLNATSASDQSEYTRHLVTMATGLSITTEHELRGVFAKHLPLDRIHPRSISRVWDVIVINKVPEQLKEEYDSVLQQDLK